MTIKTPLVRIFMMPRQSACGPQACNCSPTGQTEAQIRVLQQTIQQAVNCCTEIYDITSKEVHQQHPAILDLLRAFGLTALPVVTLNDAVVSVGTPATNEVVTAVWEKMNQMSSDL